MGKADKPKQGEPVRVKLTFKRGKANAPTVAATDSDEDTRSSKRLVVKWDEDRTNRLLDWLDQNPDDRHRLFSDSTAAAKQEGRRKVTAKGNKARYHEALAKAVFGSPDEESSLRSWYLKEPGKFTSSVINYLNR